MSREVEKATISQVNRDGFEAFILFRDGNAVSKAFTTQEDASAWITEQSDKTVKPEVTDLQPDNQPEPQELAASDMTPEEAAKLGEPIAPPTYASSDNDQTSIKNTETETQSTTDEPGVADDGRVEENPAPTTPSETTNEEQGSSEQSDPTSSKEDTGKKASKADSGTK